MAHFDDAQRSERARAYTAQPPVVDTSKPLTPAQYFEAHKANLMAVGQSDTRTDDEKSTFSFNFTVFNFWHHTLFVFRGQVGEARRFNFQGSTDFTSDSDRVAKGLGAVTAVTLDAVTNFHRWWNFHFIIRWYLTSCNYCRRNMQNEDETAQKVFAGIYLFLMAMGALASALWAVPRYFSAWQNQREGRKLKNAKARFSNIRWRALWMVPLFALIGVGLAFSFGLPLVGAAFGAICGLAFSWGYGIYASKYGVFSKADETVDLDGKHIPKKKWLKKLSKYAGFENQEVAMYAYAYLTNKMMQGVRYPANSRAYKDAVQNKVEYKLRKQFKHGDLFDVMRYFQEEHARLYQKLREHHHSYDALCKMRTDFDMLTWLLNNTLNRQTGLTMSVPAYYQQAIRRADQEVPTQVQFTSPYDSTQAERMRAQVQYGQMPNPNMQEQQQSAPSEPPATFFVGGYRPTDLPPSYDDVIAAGSVDKRPPAYAPGYEGGTHLSPSAPLSPGYYQPPFHNKKAL